jgi:class 3 adenylate cyclase
MVELPGSDHAIWTQETDTIVGEIEQLLTGSRAPVAPARVLATVMFTDIVQSTRRASELGDATWRRLLEQHDELGRREVERLEDVSSSHWGTGCWPYSPGRRVRSAAPKNS